MISQNYTHKMELENIIFIDEFIIEKFIVDYKYILTFCTIDNFTIHGISPN